ncbi:Ger(x)C family spore germination protein [Paenibacillus sp. M1]|uniref:Ger(X)C family spore germination protein n=1 Tax=Paenibacillus haidiansis TaxID=1574488 RepID=A0ABU7VTU5_9BACL
MHNKRKRSSFTGLIRRCVALGLILPLMAGTAGCWDRTEVEKLAIVAGLGIDFIPGPEPILLTVQIVNPSGLQKGGGGSSSPPFLTLSATGATILDAMRNFAKASPHRLFYGHTNVIIFGDRMAREGLHPVMDYLARAPEFRRTFWILVTPATAKEILSVKLDLEDIPALGVTEMVKEFRQSAAAVIERQKDFLSGISSKSGAAPVSRLELLDADASINERLQEVTAGDSQQTSMPAQGKKQLRLNGTAAFRKDKLVGYLSDAESRGLLWITGKLNGGSVIMPCPEDQQHKISFHIERTKSKVIPYFRDGKLNIKIDIEEESSIAEVSCDKLDVSKPETIKQLEELQAKDIEARIKSTVEKCQALRADILRFGDTAYTRFPKLWKERYEEDWPDHFANLPVAVKVTSKIRRAGMTSKSGGTTK